MARTGITKEQIYTAAEELTAKNVAATIQNIRQHLGTGSPNNIQKHLAAWKSENIVAKRHEIQISEELQKAIIREIEAINDAETTDIENQLLEERSNNEALAAESAELVEELDNTKADLAAAEDEITSKATEIQLLSNELSSKNAAIEALQQKTVDLGKLEAKIEALQSQLAKSEEVKDTLGKKLEASSAEIGTLKTENAVLVSKNEGLTKENSQQQSALVKANETIKSELIKNNNLSEELATTKLKETEKMAEAKVQLSTLSYSIKEFKEAIDKIEKTAEKEKAERDAKIAELQAQLKNSSGD